MTITWQIIIGVIIQIGTAAFVYGRLTWATIVPTSVYVIYNYDDLSDASSTL